MTARRHEALIGSTGGVLIVGGTGQVGRRLARLLSSDLGDRLLIGGRSRARASRVATALGAGVRIIDITDPETYAQALVDVDVAVVCLDTPDLKLAHAMVTRGIHCIDITATLEVIDRLGYMHDLACAHGSTLLSSVGLAPGLTNLLAKACVQACPDRVSHIDIHLLFGFGDRHGRAALEWLLERLPRPFELADERGKRRVWPFEERSIGTFPAPLGPRTTYRFDFSDQHTLPRTLDVPTVSTWLTLDRAPMARMLSRLARRGALRFSRYAPLRRLTGALMRTVRAGPDQYAVSVEARHLADASASVRYTATGVAQSHATAVVAAETVRRVMANPPPAGSFQLDELYSLDDYRSALSEHGIVVVRHGADDGPASSSTTGPVTANRSAIRSSCHERAAG